MFLGQGYRSLSSAMLCGVSATNALDYSNLLQFFVKSSRISEETLKFEWGVERKIITGPYYGFHFEYRDWEVNNFSFSVSREIVDFIQFLAILVIENTDFIFANRFLKSSDFGRVFKKVFQLHKNSDFFVYENTFVNLRG